MNKKEAILAMMSGEKIRISSWIDKTNYIMFKGSSFIDNNYNLVNLLGVNDYDLDYDLDGNWIIYQEPEKKSVLPKTENLRNYKIDYEQMIITNDNLKAERDKYKTALTEIRQRNFHSTMDEYKRCLDIAIEALKEDK